MLAWFMSTGNEDPSKVSCASPEHCEFSLIFGQEASFNAIRIVGKEQCQKNGGERYLGCLKA